MLPFHSGLRKKTVAPGASGSEESHKHPGQMDLFGQSDAVVKHVLEVCDFWYFIVSAVKYQGFSCSWRWYLAFGEYHLWSILENCTACEIVSNDFYIWKNASFAMSLKENQI